MPRIYQLSHCPWRVNPYNYVFWQESPSFLSEERAGVRKNPGITYEGVGVWINGVS